MPEPDPYYDSGSSTRPSTDSYSSSTSSSDLLKRATTSSSGGRRFPAPTSTNEARPKGSTGYGLPSSVRPPSRSRQVVQTHFSASNLDSPSSTTSPNHKEWNSPGRSSANGTGESPSSREPLARPSVFAQSPKYGSPVVPKVPPSRSYHVYDDGSGDFDPYQASVAGSNQYSHSTPWPSDTLGVPTGVNRRASKEHMRDPSEQRPSHAGFNAPQPQEAFSC
jgi:hypothetical protein